MTNENNVNSLYVSSTEALALSMLFWRITEDPSTDHDRKVDVISFAAELESKAGIPGWPTHTDTTHKVARFYEKTHSELKHLLEQPPAEGTPRSVEIRFPISVVKTLWEVAVEPKAHSNNKVLCAHFAIELERKIRSVLQFEKNEEDEDFYRRTVSALKEHIKDLDKLAKKQLKDRPADWPPFEP